MKRNRVLLKRIKKVNVIIGLFIAIIILSFSGYLFILFGGMLVVDEEALELDARTTIETSEGAFVAEVYNEKRIPVDINDIPLHVQSAFISVEDRRFREHAGIDLKSVIRAVYIDVLAGSKVEGASTITQQLAKNLFLSQDKSWMRKTKEIMAAIYLERNYSKEEILELYLNQMYFGAGVYGVEAASEYFYSKSVEELTIAEGAMLAGLAKAPNGYSPIDHPEKALNRRNVVLQVMDEAGVIHKDEREEAEEKPLGINIKETEEKPWMDSYVDYILKEAADKHDLSIKDIKSGGYRIVANVDEEIQKVAYEEFKDDAYFPGNQDDVEGAFSMMEEQSGEVVAIIGGRDYEMGDLNRTTVLRQPGSVMKPIAVYGPAMMQEAYDPYTLIRDEKLEVDGYEVNNYDQNYEGAVTIYDALLTSKNTTAVSLLNKIGIDYSKSYLEKLHISIPDEGLAIALGGLEEGLAPVDMMRSYRTFGSSGDVVEPYAIDRIYNHQGEVIVDEKPENEEVFSPQVAWDMTEILAENVRTGTAKSGTYPKALAGKTGSTQHPFVEGATKDAWFVGYTPDYVSALWIGYDQSDKDHYLEGGSEYPTQLTKEILTKVDQEKSLAESFIKPEEAEELAEPIHLPEIKNVNATYSIGGETLIQGKLTWEGPSGDPYIYRVYRMEKDGAVKVGEVEGDTEIIIDQVSPINSQKYYVVAYNPLTKMEGIPSESVEFTW